MSAPATGTRERVLQVAHDLFYWHGIHATSIESVAAKAGVTTSTVYRMFPGKEALVVAYMSEADRKYRQWFESVTRPDSDDPRERILNLFEALTESVQPDRLGRGCLFLHALGEFGDPDESAHQIAVATKSWMRARIGELARDLAEVADVADPSKLADELALIMEGVYASVCALGSEGPATYARALAEAFLPRPKGPPAAALHPRHRRLTTVSAGSVLPS